MDKSLSFLPGQHGAKCRDRECSGCVPHPLRAEVDEDLPRSRGGSATDRANCRLMHRECNRWKGKMTLTEARAKRAGVSMSSVPLVITNLVRW
ncbi:HNH endonuclease [Microbacterium halotolerans]|uniref:HNH endonuclease n=1 Tax=Microbacterium halotolerans TaxID=246613 RepID=UPI0013C31822|nr:HNH endonuclease [Microbacterium halotolerans]